MSYGIAVLACPHCGCSSSYKITMSSGTIPAQCRQCHKSFRIYVSQGMVRDVRHH